MQGETIQPGMQTPINQTQVRQTRSSNVAQVQQPPPLSVLPDPVKVRRSLNLSWSKTFFKDKRKRKEKRFIDFCIFPFSTDVNENEIYLFLSF